MDIQFTVDGKKYGCHLDQPLHISIPVHFDGAQPNTYGVPKASARAYEDGSFIGDTRKGGSCNFAEYRIIPHCNGTHTECVGHLALERISLHSIPIVCLLPATLITVTPEDATETSERAEPPAKPADRMITRACLAPRLVRARSGFTEALIVRTLPNDHAKKAQEYSDPPPPYFSTEAMQLIDETNTQHLLVDVPSVDRTYDEGKMTTHHDYWHIERGSHDVKPTHHSLKTITEMIYVAEEILDGRYLLNIQIPSFVADAAPSRPLLFAVEQIDY